MTQFDMFSRPCVNARLFQAASSKGDDPKQVPWPAFVILRRFFRPIHNILHVQRASRITLKIQIKFLFLYIFPGTPKILVALLYLQHRIPFLSLLRRRSDQVLV